VLSETQTMVFTCICTLVQQDYFHNVSKFRHKSFCNCRKMSQVGV